MVDKKHESSKKGQCCSNKLHLIVIIVLAALLGVSGYFNYNWFKKIQSFEKTGFVNTGYQPSEGLVSGEIVSLSDKQLIILDTNNNQITYNLDDKTIYQKTQEGGGNFVKADKSDFMEGKEVIVILSTDKKIVQELDLVL